MKQDLRRQSLIILGALVAMIMTSCNTQPVETAPAGGTPPVKTPIGPIPGAEQVVKLSPNPYAQNPMALQEGRRLFVWYNCAGCHGGHAGGGGARFGACFGAGQADRHGGGSLVRPLSLLFVCFPEVPAPVVRVIHDPPMCSAAS